MGIKVESSMIIFDLEESSWVKSAQAQHLNFSQGSVGRDVCSKLWMQRIFLECLTNSELGPILLHTKVLF